MPDGAAAVFLVFIRKTCGNTVKDECVCFALLAYSIGVLDTQ